MKKENNITLNKVAFTLKNISPSFCAAKWLQNTLYLQTGFNHSCHHPAPHKIPLEELQENHKALHNTQFKKQQMQKMLDGERPAECDYCWKVEDLGNTSDRYLKSGEPWAFDLIPKILETKTQDINPSYLEISFSNVCNFKCAYCSPEISSKWVEEIKQFGPYPTSWNTGELKPMYSHNEHNPYVEAFWKWWPELSTNLTNLRLTGGEPLLSKDVWALLEKLDNDPNLNPELTLGINTNLNVPKHLIDKLIKIISSIAPRIKQVQLFTSNEAVGAQAEYVRYGLNYDEWFSNLDNLIANLPQNSFVGIMTTINILSLSTIDLFIEDIMSLRRKYFKSYDNNNIILSINYLRWPPFLHPELAPQDLKENTIKKLEILIEKYKDGKQFEINGTYDILYQSDIEKLNMICNLLNYPVKENLRSLKDFYNFVTESDIRKNTNFNLTFPELIEFKNYCSKVVFND
jgi:organic radical activating enzyme